MPVRSEPPRLLVVALFAGLAALLFYPLHRPYLHPDQDVLPTLPLVQMAQATWSPLVLQYGSAFPNLLRVLDTLLLRLGRVAGWWQSPTDLLLAWCEAPWLFRIPTRAIAMAAGLGSLLAARGLTALVTDRWSALVAAALLGSWIMFVREHHHGWYDAPAAGASMLALWAATAFVWRGRLRDLIVAAALAGLATSFKFNLLPTVPAVLAAVLVAKHERRLHAAVTAGAAAAAAFALTTPEILLEPARLYAHVSAFIPVQAKVLAHGAGGQGNQLADTLVRGMGWVGLGTAAIGFSVALARRERALAPVLVFVVLYGLVLVRSPLALGRYALPIAGPLAVLAAYALARLPGMARLVVASVLIGLGLPGTIGYVRLLAVEDTRTEAVRLVEAEWARGGRVVLATHPLLWMYVGPAVAQLPRYEGGLPAEVARTLAARMPHCVNPMETMSGPPSAYAGALIVTSDPPAPPFELASTPPATAAILEREATLVADLSVETTPERRPYEPFDLNYVPWGSLGSLERPGPRLRFWRLPADP